jgi:uncharacterized protein YdiU (UPF0061 family)
MIQEDGAIVCRVARTFLRFGHLELLAKRQEMSELVILLNYLCLREYPSLLEAQGDINGSEELPHAFLTSSIAEMPIELIHTAGPMTRYITLFRHITHNIAYMVSQWLRVGYIQGNVNSDNTLLSGATVDYGPFGFMERYEPFYTVFTSDPLGRAGFMRQPDCLHLNVTVLGKYL